MGEGLSNWLLAPLYHPFLSLELPRFVNTLMSLNHVQFIFDHSVIRFSDLFHQELDSPQEIMKCKSQTQYKFTYKLVEI